MDQSNVRNAKAVAVTGYLRSGANGKVEHYYDASSGKVTSDFSSALAINGYGKSTMQEDGVVGTGKVNDKSGIVMGTVSSSVINEVRSTKNETEIVTNDTT